MKKKVVILNLLALKSGGGVQVGIDFLSNLKNSTEFEWDLIEPGINGFLVKPGSVNSLSDAMQRYVQGGKQLALAHGQESLRISQNFTCEASAKRLVQTLHSWTAKC
jgi:glycosyltransferase involved in cell wall biosynthesis